MNDMTEQLSISYNGHLYGKVAQMDEYQNEKIEIKKAVMMHSGQNSKMGEKKNRQY